MEKIASLPTWLKRDTAVSKSPSKEIIPQFSFSRSLQNNGPSLASRITQSITKSLGIRHVFILPGDFIPPERVTMLIRSQSYSLKMFTRRLISLGGQRH